VFTIATESQIAEAAELSELVRSSEVPLLSVAAMWCEQNDFFSESIEAYRRRWLKQPFDGPAFCGPCHSTQGLFL
jgi:hypothetical protein